MYINASNEIFDKSGKGGEKNKKTKQKQNYEHHLGMSIDFVFTLVDHPAHMSSYRPQGVPYRPQKSQATPQKPCKTFVTLKTLKPSQKP